MKKIVFVINYFYPDLASTGQLMTELCLDLQHSFNITVIAAQPGYSGEKVVAKKKYEINYYENIKVIRILLPTVDKTSKLSRAKYVLSYFLFATIALLKERHTDLIYTISQPPIIGGLIGTIGKFVKKTKLVYNIQDFNPEQAEAISYTNNRIIISIARYLDKLNCRYSDTVILVGKDMCQTLKKRFLGANIPKHIVINNWTDEKKLIPLSKKDKNVYNFLKKNGLENKFVVMYSGNLGLYYDLENLIKITPYFKDYNIAFVFIGEGAVKSKMQDYINNNKISNVYFLPYQPKEKIKYSLNAADIHLVVNQKGIKGVSVPSKIYGVMAVGKPVIGVLEKDSEAQKLIEESNCGLTVEPKDYDGVIESIKTLYNMEPDSLHELGLNGRTYLEKNLTKEISISKYRKALKTILNS